MAKVVHMTDLWRPPWIEGVKFKRQHPSEARRKCRREDHLACAPQVVSTAAGASTISSTNRTIKPAGRANPRWYRASRGRCSLCSWRTLHPSKTPRTTSLALSPPECTWQEKSVTRTSDYRRLRTPITAVAIIWSRARGEPAVSYRWIGWVWEITGWSSRLQENHPIILEESVEHTSNE